MKAEMSGKRTSRPSRLLTVAGAAQVRSAQCELPLLLPVELRRVNHTASTNSGHCKTPRLARTLQYLFKTTDTMADPTPFDQISERVERLLLRHEELQRTNALLLDQVQKLEAERDSLKSRLNAARARIDALLDRLPTIPSAPPAGPEGTE
jgi:chromosome segregation ATPase